MGTAAELLLANLACASLGLTDLRSPRDLQHRQVKCNLSVYMVCDAKMKVHKKKKTALQR